MLKQINIPTSTSWYLWQVGVMIQNFTLDKGSQGWDSKRKYH